MLLGLALSLTATAGCGDDVVDIPETQRGEPYCMIVSGAWGHFADGSVVNIHWVDLHAAAGCACIDPDDRWDEDTLEMLNELAYQDCELAAKQWTLEWNECQEDFEAGTWLNSVAPVGEGSEDEHFRPPDLQCY
jgi:hypothetical protein